MNPPRRLTTLSVLAFIAGLATEALGQADSSQLRLDSLKSYTTAMLQGEPPKIDGLGDDPAWEQVPWGGGDFRQRNPNAGAAPSVQTQFKILYDAKNIYFLFKNLDPDPSKIVKRMSRRDGFDGDWVEVNIDSYYDKRSAFSFTSSVSGVKGDEYVSNNGDDWDTSWDPIWYLKTSINAEGWIAELRIPLSQLRFADKPEHVWGIQIQRRFFRNQERSMWQYVPPTANGWVHHFAELRGIKGIRPQKQLEIQPYIVGRTETYQKEDGNPFRPGQESNVAVGVDAKIGLTSDITLDLTVNPDFGQVEADPSQVNLTAFELFFREQRPFFIEGNNILNYPLSNFNNDNLFYSRRIGRSPQGSVDLAPVEFSKQASRTQIWGAAKVTGKNKNGFSWGILESVTAPEKATIDNVGERRLQTVEPMSNYFVARAQQDINKGNTIIGAMLTATHRKIEDQNLDWLHREAWSGGLDLVQNWQARKYTLKTQVYGSYVKGSNAAILNTQLSSERYFQRPDNNYSGVDSTRRSLLGTGGLMSFAKKTGKLTYEVGGSWMSPQLELNDIGFLRQTDLIRQWGQLQYRVVHPVGITRSQFYSLFQMQRWDFDGKVLSKEFEAFGFLEFKNFWEGGGGGGMSLANASNADLRGGPSMRYPGNFYSFFFISTDSRKKLQLNLNPSFQWGAENYSSSVNFDMDLTYRPTNALRITLSPGWYVNQTQVQYVETADASGSPRYIMGEIDQTTFRVSLRLTYMVTPNLSIQYWGQPFGTAGRYANFKNMTNTGADAYTDRFAQVPASQISLNGGMYEVDENSNGTTDYSFAKPDFNFGQFKSNMVVRWEYIPGSTLFLVWTQQMDGGFYTPKDANHSQYEFDFNQQAHNIFVIKYTYRFRL